MSIYKVIQVEKFKSRSALEKALWEVTRYPGRDVIIAPQGDRIDTTRNGDVIMRVKFGNFTDARLRWNVDFLQQDDGSFLPAMDDFAESGFTQRVLPRLRQQYLYYETIETAQMQGYQVTEQTAPDGTITLSLEMA